MGPFHCERFDRCRLEFISTPNEGKTRDHDESKSLNHRQEVLVARYPEHSVNDLCRSGQRFSIIVLDARILPTLAEPFKEQILLPNLRDLN